MSEITQLAKYLNARQGVVSVRDFGAVPDGVTDSGAAIKNCLEWCSKNNAEAIIDGDFYFASAMEVWLYGPLRVFQRGRLITTGSDNKEWGILFRPSASSTVPDANFPAISMTGNYAAGSKTLTLASTAGISVGDVLHILSTEAYTTRSNVPDVGKQILSRVTRVVDATTVEIADQFPYSISAAGTFTYQWNYGRPRRLELYNVGVEFNSSSGSQTQYGMRIQQCTNVLIDGGRGRDFTFCECLYLWNYGLTIRNVYSRPQPAPSFLQNNYAIAVGACTNVRIEGCDIVGHRHAIALSNSPCTNVVVQNCNLASTTTASFDAHTTNNVVIDNCSLPDGVLLGCGEFLISNSTLGNIKIQPSAICELRADYNSFFRGVEFVNCTFNYKMPTSGWNSSIVLRWFGDSANQTLKDLGYIRIRNCSLRQVDGSGGRMGAAVAFTGLSAEPMTTVGEVTIDGLTCYMGLRGGFASIGTGVVSATNRGTLSMKNCLVQECNGPIRDDANSPTAWEHAFFSVIEYVNNRPRTLRYYGEAGFVAGDHRMVMINAQLQRAHYVVEGNIFTRNSDWRGPANNVRWRNNTTLERHAADGDRVWNALSVEYTGNITYDRSSTSYVEPASFTGSQRIIRRANVAYYRNSTSWDPASVSAGGTLTANLTITGAQVGDPVTADFSLSLNGLILNARVNAANNVLLQLFNPTGSAIDLANGTVQAVVQRLHDAEYPRIAATAAPSTGAWIRGDVVWNSEPSAAGVIGWVCTASGSPGTWKTFGTIAP